MLVFDPMLSMTLALLVGGGLATYFGTAQAIGGLDLRVALRELRRRKS